jgi:hypothetical protein
MLRNSRPIPAQPIDSRVSNPYEEKNRVDHPLKNINKISEISKIRKALTCPVTNKLLQIPVIGLECGHVYSQNKNVLSGLPVTIDSCPVAGCSDSDINVKHFILDSIIAEIGNPACLPESFDATDNSFYEYCRNFSEDKFQRILSMLECPISHSFFFDPVTTPCGHTFESKYLQNSGRHICALCNTPFNENQIIKAVSILEIVHWFSLLRPGRVNEEYNAADFEPGNISDLLEKNDPTKIKYFIRMLLTYPDMLNKQKHRSFLSDSRMEILPQYSILMMLASHKLGIDLLISSNELRQAITADGLNVQISQGRLKGYSALHLLTQTFKGCKVFNIDTSLRRLINSNNFNDINLESKANPPCFLASQFASGLTMLTADSNLRDMITESTLNQPRELHENKVSLLSLLVSHTSGINMLETDMTLLNKVNTEAVNYTNPDGTSATYIYLSQKENSPINIFRMNNRLSSMISEHLLGKKVTFRKDNANRYANVLFLLTYFPENLNYISNNENILSKISLIMLEENANYVTKDGTVVTTSPFKNIIINKPSLILKRPRWKEYFLTLDKMDAITLYQITTLEDGIDHISNNTQLCNSISADNLNKVISHNQSMLTNLLTSKKGCDLLNNNKYLCHHISSNHLKDIIINTLGPHFLFDNDLGLKLLRNSVVFRSKLTMDILALPITAPDGHTRVIENILIADYPEILHMILCENPESGLMLHFKLSSTQRNSLEKEGVYYHNDVNAIQSDAEEIFLIHFKQIFLRDYQKNKNLFENACTIQHAIKLDMLNKHYLEDYCQSHPDSRAAKIYDRVSTQIAEVKELNLFRYFYITAYKSTFFRNPFSQMKKNIENVLTMNEIEEYANEHHRSRTHEIMKYYR